MRRLVGIVLVAGCLLSNVSRAAPFPGLSLERPSLFWGASTRADGTTRFWDPQSAVAVNSNLVNVIYWAFDENGKNRNIGPLPPALLAKTLQNAAPELEECHRLGIKVMGYADTIQFLPSTFQSEGIDPENLYARDINGKPVPCDTWIKGAFISCINNPHWIELQKQVTAVTAEAGFDALQFDLYPYAVLPGYHCHCQHCQSQWKDYSEKKFGAAQAQPPTTLSKGDPVHRTYVEWRMMRMADFLKATQSHAQKSHPDFVVLQNNCVDGTDYPYLALNDAIDFPSTELWHLALGEESSLHMYRLAEALNGGKAYAIINSLPQVEPMYRYQAAIGEAYAGGSAIHVGGNSLESTSQEYFDFIEKNEDWYIDTQSDAAVGILFSWRDAVFIQNEDFSTTHIIPWKENSFRRAAAVLARQGIPYDFVVIEKGLAAAQLARYKVLVAPEITLLDDADAMVLKDYVSSGGRLLSLGSLGASKSAGNDFVSRSTPLFTEWTGQVASESYGEASLGSGAIAYVAAAFTGDTEKTMVLTEDFKRGSQYIGLGAQLALKSSALVEATIRSKNAQKFIHLVRLGPAEDADAVSASIDYTLPPNSEVASVEAASPAASAELGLTWSLTSPGILHIDLKRLDQYVVVHLMLKPAATPG